MTTENTPKVNNTILVPLDFSTAANNALEHAVNIANLFGNDIALLYVVQESWYKSVFGSNVERNLLMEQVARQLEERRQAILDKNPKLTVSVIVNEGHIHKQIIEVAKELNCDSIVMGYHGESALDQVIGSTTMRILNASPVPVVVVKEVPSSLDYKKIVLPIDLTRESRQKVSWGIHLAKKYDSEVHVIMEVEDDEFLMHKVNNNLAQVERLLAAENVRFVSKILSDQEYPEEFGKDIVQYADEIKADLIMIMTQKEGGIMDLFVGSFARQIIQGSHVPVMAINPKELGVHLVPGY
ncbi:MAG: universal stress protein [Flavobacteriales bacterium]|nr:universal stress protein [Flavobacteriales bacterium]